MSVILVNAAYPAYNMGQTANQETNRRIKPEAGSMASCGCKGQCNCGKANESLPPHTNNALGEQLGRMERKQDQLIALQMQNQAQLAQIQSRLNFKA